MQFSFRDKLLELLKDKDDGLDEFVMDGLRTNRAQFIGEAARVLNEHPGQLRLSLLAAMVADGGVDLIPVFSAFTARETNVLFAKSLLNLIAQFDHFEAITALRDMQPRLHPDVQTAAGRIIAKLSGKFREQFYMDEFRAGESNPKRLKHAVDAMLANPHALYVPFLNEVLGDEKSIFREPAVAVLAEVADKSSVEPLKKLLTQLVYECGRNDKLCNFLLTQTTKNALEYLQGLSVLGNWEAGLAEELAQELLNKRIKTTLEWLISSFGPYPKLLADGLEPFLNQQLKNGTVDASMKGKLNVAYQANRDNRISLLRTIASTLGRVGRQYKVEDLEDAFDSILPPDFMDRSVYHIAFLCGNRSAQAIERLVAYLTPETDLDLLSVVLDALAQCDLRQQPPGLYALAANPENRKLQKQALNLFVQCRPTDEQIKSLLQHESQYIRFETRSIVTQLGIEEGYAFLLEQLQQSTDDEEIILLIEALAIFPRGQTGAALIPFLLPPHGPKVRKTALNYIIKAGGPTRTDLIFNAIGTLPPGEAGPMIAMVLSALEVLRADTMPPDILNNKDHWLPLLGSKNARYRDGAISILARADWCKSRDDGWAEALEGVITDSVIRSDAEKGRVRHLVQWATSHEGSGRDINMKFRRELLLLMETIETGTEYEKTSALRKLNIIYKEELVEPQDKSRLVYQMSSYFQKTEGDPAGLKLGISIAARVADVKLLEEVAKLEKHPDVNIARFAHQASDVAFKNAGQVREVRSIFLVDNNQLMTKTLSKALQKVGFEVTCATDPREALSALKKQPYDLLICSFRINNEFSGVQLLKEARFMHVAPARSIFITSSRDSKEEKEMTTAGVSAILFKPFPMDHLYEKIKDLTYAGELHLNP